DARRALRGPGPGTDEEDPPDADHPHAFAVLGRPYGLDARSPGERTHDRRRGSAADPADRRPERGRERNFCALRKARVPAPALGAGSDAESVGASARIPLPMRKLLPILLLAAALPVFAQSGPTLR